MLGGRGFVLFSSLDPRCSMKASVGLAVVVMV
jgi:hypothetical protein